MDALAERVIGMAEEKFDAGGVLTDEPAREFIARLLTKLAAWTRTLRAPAAPLNATSGAAASDTTDRSDTTEKTRPRWGPTCCHRRGSATPTSRR